VFYTYVQPITRFLRKAYGLMYLYGVQMVWGSNGFISMANLTGNIVRLIFH